MGSISSPIVAPWNYRPAAKALPIPLTADARRHPRFPVEHLPSLLKNAVEAIVDYVDCPPALAAMSVLSAASLAVQGHADIATPTGPKPLSLFLLSVAQTGERKTAADKRALVPVTHYESELNTEYRNQCKQYDDVLAVYNADYKPIVNDNKLSTKEKTEKLTALIKPMPPLKPFLTTDEPTIEGLFSLFLTGRPAIGLFSDEGGSFIGGFGMSEDNRLKTASHLCKMWDTGTLKRVRQDADAMYILFGRRLAFHLMMQPVVADKLYAMHELREQGLHSRILLSFPMSTIGTRMQHETRPESKEHLHAYYARLYKILKTPLPHSDTDPQNLTPRELRFTDSAIELWQIYADSIEEKQRAGGIYEPICGFASKMNEHACRIAGVLSFFERFSYYMENPHDITVGEEVFEQAMVITDYFADQLLSMLQTTDDSEDLDNAKKLLAFLQDKWPERFVHERVIFNKAPRSVRGKEHETERARAIDILLRHGWLTPAPPGTLVEGRTTRPDTPTWEIYKAK